MTDRGREEAVELYQQIMRLGITKQGDKIPGVISTAISRARAAAIEEAYEAGRDDGYDLHIHDKDGEYPDCGSDREAFMDKQKNDALRTLSQQEDGK